ncbi:hypothetical protein WISP_38876 [Willisornis vidua]|uniref:Glypican-1 n=1 Tax=Willisornis vidua TaxID=1566151 RepID=A0ABQ9DHK0_9PASS|nr:hypothetical protein WISP_38876 [Willisornis vidua]
MSSPASGEHLRICPQGYTCCTSEMEENFANKSRSEFEAMVKEAGRSVQATLTAQHRSFDKSAKFGGSLEDYIDEQKFSSEELVWYEHDVLVD